ncbi:pyridoxamine 5'-phosphate oxidase family protein [Blastococcus sp. VKM Ac-2987]|uniref:pyridoxamine 5'-phosphate oxidase family protein n=1 Tax=Blastococcus sp. VKM Ac-2987 TaxID=3004141 RepID=UPI0022ABA0FC|nr:pyridoxamine 5'-phosphate oxidase family protein [Blastococcus sp. VKM Ac-2987]MCZ2860508.1 pyridoxamine 5'-phosphate oxidase family protein [Blastococcus sp. VKM Ac-2987]
MPTTDEDRIVDVLDEAECRRLLGTAGIGRLGFTDGALPAIVPVSFALHDGSVLIPGRLGNRIVDAVRRTVVVLGVDAYDGETRTGWGVTVVGPSRVVSDPAHVLAHDRLGLLSPPSGPGRCYIAVQIGLLSGWRMRLPAVLPSAGPVVTGYPAQA